MSTNKSQSSHKGRVQGTKPARLRAACNPCHNAKVSCTRHGSDSKMSTELYCTSRFDVVASEMAVYVVEISITSMRASTAFQGLAELQPDPKKMRYRT